MSINRKRSKNGLFHNLPIRKGVGMSTNQTKELLNNLDSRYVLAVAFSVEM
jgi:hypothetical protein